MPFDGNLSNPLAELGLTPITEQRAAQWRAWVVERFRASSKENRRRVDSKLARWVTDECTLDSFSCYAFQVPEPVKQLARKIADHYPNARSSLQYFDKDPILYMQLDGQRYCLAIWDKGVVRAIAGGVDLPRWQRIKRCFVTVV